MGLAVQQTRLPARSRGSSSILAMSRGTATTACRWAYPQHLAVLAVVSQDVAAEVGRSGTTCDNVVLDKAIEAQPHQVHRYATHGSR
jgi:hypothetical protein